MSTGEYESFPSLASTVGIDSRQLKQLLNLARTDLNSGRFEDAEEVLDVLTTLDPFMVTAWQLTAKLYQKRGWIERANVINEFCKGIEND